MECITCTWCSSWKGSSAAKVINQHLKKSVSHTKERRARVLSSKNRPCSEDIRSYMNLPCPEEDQENTSCLGSEVVIQLSSDSEYDYDDSDDSDASADELETADLGK